MLNRIIVFTREHERETYTMESFAGAVRPGLRMKLETGRSYEWCVCVEHFEQMRGADISWTHRGVQPTLSIAALRGCVTYTRGARA